MHKKALFIHHQNHSLNDSLLQYHKTKTRAKQDSTAVQYPGCKSLILDYKDEWWWSGEDNITGCDVQTHVTRMGLKWDGEAGSVLIRVPLVPWNRSESVFHWAFIKALLMTHLSRRWTGALIYFSRAGGPDLKPSSRKSSDWLILKHTPPRSALSSLWLKVLMFVPSSWEDMEQGESHQRCEWTMINVIPWLRNALWYQSTGRINKHKESV